MVDDDDIIGAAITDYYGSRCPDYASECPCCRAWSEYDRLSAQKCEPVVRVKELEWASVFGRPATRAESLSSIGLYIIADLDGTERFSVGLDNGACAAFLLDEAGDKQLRYSSIHEAKSAAQADYEQRIMAAIEIIPAVAEASSDGGTEGRAGATNSDSGVPVASDSSPSHPSTIETCVRPAAGVESCPSETNPSANLAPSSTVEPTAHNSLDAGSSPAAPTISDGGSPGPSPLAANYGASDPASGRSQPSPDVSVDELADALRGAWTSVAPLLRDFTAQARTLLSRFRIERLDRLAGGRR